MAGIIPVMGEYRYAIDQKHRLFIPAKHREALGDPLVIFPNFRTPSLRVVSVEQWEEIFARISALPAAKRELMLSFLNSKGDTLSPDSQGRVTLNQGLVDHAGLSGQVVIVGCGKDAAIWSAENYRPVTVSDFGEMIAEYADEADVF